MSKNAWKYEGRFGDLIVHEFRNKNLDEIENEIDLNSRNITQKDFDIIQPTIDMWSSKHIQEEETYNNNVADIFFQFATILEQEAVDSNIEVTEDFRNRALHHFVLSLLQLAHNNETFIQFIEEIKPQ